MPPVPFWSQSTQWFLSSSRTGCRAVSMLTGVIDKAKFGPVPGMTSMTNRAWNQADPPRKTDCHSRPQLWPQRFHPGVFIPHDVEETPRLTIQHAATRPFNKADRVVGNWLTWLARPAWSPRIPQPCGTSELNPSRRGTEEEEKPGAAHALLI
jgi:hypothetical protein